MQPLNILVELPKSLACECERLTTETAGLIARLRQGGLDQEVESWLGPGPNLPVTPELLRAALGENLIEQFVAATGISADKLLVLMAGYLPNAIDAMSPNGTIEGAPPA